MGGLPLQSCHWNEEHAAFKGWQPTQFLWSSEHWCPWPFHRTPCMGYAYASSFSRDETSTVHSPPHQAFSWSWYKCFHDPSYWWLHPFLLVRIDWNIIEPCLLILYQPCHTAILFISCLLHYMVCVTSLMQSCPLCTHLLLSWGVEMAIKFVKCKRFGSWWRLWCCGRRRQWG